MSYLLLILLFIVLSFILVKLRWVRRAGIKNKVLILLFGIKALVGFALVMLYSTYYDKESSDIFLYFNDAIYLKNLLINNREVFINILFDHNNSSNIIQDFEEPLRFWDSSSVDFLIHEKRIVILLNMVFGFISFNNIYIHSMLMAFIGFIGQIAIFRFVKKHSQIQALYILLLTFLLPTFLIWTSSILKEPLVIFTMGMTLFYMGKWTKKWKLNYLFALVLFYLVGFLIKPYVFLALSFPIIIFLVFKIRDEFSFKKQSIIVFTSVVLLGIVFWLMSFVNVDLFEKLSNKQADFYHVIQLAEEKSNVDSQIQLNKLEPNVLSFLYNVPKAFVNVMFRPNFYDFKSVLYFPDIIQNLIILLLSLFLIFKHRKPKPNERPFIWFSLLFIIILFTLIGLVTPILGAIVRYKVPALIFVFFFLLSFLNTKVSESKISRFPFFRPER